MPGAQRSQGRTGLRKEGLRAGPRSCFQGDELGFELGRLKGERLRVVPGRDAHDLEAVGVFAHDVEGLLADAACGAEDRKASQKGVGSNLIRVARCSIPPGP